MSSAPRAVIFDIETGPGAEAEIDQWYEPPKKTFDPKDVKTGNLGPDKATQKVVAARAAHQKMLADHRNAFKERAALDPKTGRVLAIGYGFVYPKKLEYKYGFCELSIEETPESWDAAERWLLDDFWARIETSGPSIKWIGHNIFGFDLPFLMARSWKHGIEVPPSLREKSRYWHPRFRDTMDTWRAGRPGVFVKLDHLARFFGVGQKTEGVSGADFARLWEEDRSKAIEYLRNDLAMSHRVAERMGLC